MPNFEVFQCNVCSRKIEKLVDQTHATLNKCVITYKCTGNLLKISQSDTKTMSGSSTKTGLTNWTSRGGTKPSQTSLVTFAPVVLNTGANALTIAIDELLVSGIHELNMNLEIKKLINNSYVEYFYTRSSNTSIISGQDDSSKRLSLRFINGSSADQLTVYVNGVLYSPSKYDRSISGRLTFNSPLESDSNQIRILVYKQAEPVLASLTFIRNDLAGLLANPKSAWANVSEVGIPKNSGYSVFSCVDISGLPINSQLLIDSIVPKNGDELEGPIGYWLLADTPYTSYDRDTLNSIPLRDMIVNADVIEYKNDIKNFPMFFVDSTMVLSMFPPISVAVKLGDDIDLKTSSDLNTRLVNSYIT